jgi:hypothetical protein
MFAQEIWLAFWHWVRLGAEPVKDAALSFLLIMSIIFVVQFVIYATTTAFTGPETPGGSPLAF